MRRKFIAIILLLIAAIGCDKGLAPPPPDSTTTLSGSVHFSGVLPNCDSIIILAVVLTEQSAPFSISDVFLNYGKTIFVNQLNTCPIRDTSFSFTLKPGTYNYLGVVEKYGEPDSLTLGWSVLGFAHTIQDSATSFVLAPGEQRDSIVLQARFDSLPRQPFIK